MCIGIKGREGGRGEIIYAADKDVLAYWKIPKTFCEKQKRLTTLEGRTLDRSYFEREHLYMLENGRTPKIIHGKQEQTNWTQ